MSVDLKVVDYLPTVITPDVIELTPDDYQAATQKFIKLFKEAHPGEAAFYQFGVLRNPGISDIDMMIVLRDGNWKGAWQTAMNIIRGDGFLSYLFTHEPLIIGESLLPYINTSFRLPVCTFIEGDWDPISEFTFETLSNDSQLIRSAASNGNGRLFMLQVMGRPIGVKKALLSMHGLLSEAYESNRYLSSPLPKKLVTEEIRKEVLAAKPEHKGSLCYDYIKKVVEFTNEVDMRLSEELLESCESKAPLYDTMSFVGPHLVTPLDAGVHLNAFGSLFKNSVYKRVSLVPVPPHVLYLCARIAEELKEEIPNMFLQYKGILKAYRLKKELDYSSYISELKKSKAVHDKHKVNYFPLFLPFLHYNRCKTSLKVELIRHFRQIGIQASSNPKT